MSFALDEQETIITIPREGDTVTVWSSHRPHVGRLRKLIQTKGIGKELSGDEYSATFEFPSENFSITGALRAKRKVSEAQREAARARLAAARAEKENQ